MSIDAYERREFLIKINNPPIGMSGFSRINPQDVYASSCNQATMYGLPIMARLIKLESADITGLRTLYGI